jgi:hypothetical protein
MSMRHAILPLVLLAVLVSAPSAGAQALPPDDQVLVPGNYCVSCHTATDPALTALGQWQARPPEEATCPGVKAYREELLYTEQLLTATERAGAAAGAKATAAQANRVNALRTGLDALRQAPVTSLDAFVSSAQMLRFQGNKAYTALNDAIISSRQNWVLLFAALVTLFIVGSLFWGLRNTVKISGATSTWARWHPGWRTVAVIALVLLLFALPLFRVPSAAVVLPTAEEQAVQTALDTTDRVADAADRALARAWMMARVGAAWSQLDPTQGQDALDAALAAVGEAQAYADALWGQAQAAQEAAIGSVAAQEEAALLAERLASVQSRAWGLRLIAAEWAAVDPARAAEIMAQAEVLAGSNRSAYGPVDLAAIAADWARIDGQRAAAAAAGVTDARLRARAEQGSAAAASAPDAPYVLRTDSLVAPGTGVEAAREQLLTLDREADKAEVLRFVAASTGAREDFDSALAMALAARVRGDALAPAEASLALAKAMLPVDAEMARAAFVQAYEVAQKIAVTYQ